MKPVYKRMLLKLSGEALMGEQEFGIESEAIATYAKQIKEVYDMGIELAIVIGGGNIFRGLSGSDQGVDRVTGDHMGMLATVINSLALQNAIEKQRYRFASRRTRRFRNLISLGEFYSLVVSWQYFGSVF